jgi:hypothetical protein
MAAMLKSRRTSHKLILSIESERICHETASERAKLTRWASSISTDCNSQALVLTRNHAVAEDFDTGNLRSRHTGYGEAASRRQYKEVVLQHPENI